MVRKRSSIIVSKHGCCPKLHEPVYMRLWHLVLREQKFCGLKFDTIHKGIPVILPRSILRSGQGTWREIISIPVCWCSYAFEIISNAMRIVLPSRMGWYSLVHCEGLWPINGGGSSWITARCIGGPFESRLEWTRLICCVKPEQFFNFWGQNGQERSWDCKDMAWRLRKKWANLYCVHDPYFLTNKGQHHNAYKLYLNFVTCHRITS